MSTIILMLALSLLLLWCNTLGGPRRRP